MAKYVYICCCLQYCYYTDREPTWDPAREYPINTVTQLEGKIRSPQYPFYISCHLGGSARYCKQMPSLITVKCCHLF